MRAIAPLVVTLTGILAAFPSSAPAQPSVCRGTFDIQGDALDLGAPAAPVQSISVRGGRVVSPVGGDPVDAPFDVRLGDCTATVVTQAPRTDAFALRARFEGCGAHPRFRVRLLFDADCRTARVRVRAGGRVVGELTAALRRFGRPSDSGTPGGTTTTTLPDAGTVTPVGTTPTISAFSPLTVAPGAALSVFGSNLDRDASGATWTGTTSTPPYFVIFASTGNVIGGGRIVPTFVSANELRVVVPTVAASGTIKLVQRLSTGRAGATIAETAERLLVVADDAPATPAVPTTGTPPSTENRGTVTIQATQTSLLDAGTFPASGTANQIGAFLDTNDDGIVDLIGGANDVPYPAFPVRSSEFDFSVTAGRAYFPGANAMLWVFFEGGNPAVLEANDRFFVVHLQVDLAARTARPIAMLAGSGGDPGLVMLADQFADDQILVAQPGGGIGALRGHISAVPSFLQLIFIPSQPSVCPDPLTFCGDTGPFVEQRLWANGVDIRFDVPLFADNG